MAKEYKVWIEIEEYDDKTEEYTNDVTYCPIEIYCTDDFEIAKEVANYIGQLKLQNKFGG